MYLIIKHQQTHRYNNCLKGPNRLHCSTLSALVKTKGRENGLLHFELCVELAVQV